MHALLHILAATTSTTAKPKSSSSSSPTFLIFILVIFVAAYFLFLRPRQQRMRQQQSAARQLSVGDQVVTAGGIYGTVVAIDDSVVEVEVSPGVVMTFLRRAVNARPGSAPPGPAPADDDWNVPGNDTDTVHDGRAGPRSATDSSISDGATDAGETTSSDNGTNSGTGTPEDPPGSQTEHRG